MLGVIFFAVNKPLQSCRLIAITENAFESRSVFRRGGNGYYIAAKQRRGKRISTRIGRFTVFVLRVAATVERKRGVGRFVRFAVHNGIEIFIVRVVTDLAAEVFDFYNQNFFLLGFERYHVARYIVLERSGLRGRDERGVTEPVESYERIVIEPSRKRSVTVFFAANAEDVMLGSHILTEQEGHRSLFLRGGVFKRCPVHSVFGYLVSTFECFSVAFYRRVVSYSVYVVQNYGYIDIFARFSGSVPSVVRSAARGVEYEFMRLFVESDFKRADVFVVVEKVHFVRFVVSARNVHAATAKNYAVFTLVIYKEIVAAAEHIRVAAIPYGVQRRIARHDYRFFA